MEMSEVLLQISDKLGVASTEVFRIFVEAQAYIGITKSASLIIPIIIIAIISYKYRESIKSHIDNDIDELIPIIGLMLIVYVHCVFGLILFFEALTPLVLPEYSAMLEIFGLAGQII